jgi:hypothetical protein
MPEDIRKAPVAAAPATNPQLDRPIQDHLGRQLRSILNQVADKPAYLGDPALPPEFDQQLHRLERTVKTHEIGVRAVGEALGIDDAEDLEDAGSDRAGERTVE